MKLNLAGRRKWILAGVVILGTATPSFAIFGLGDIVFDPTSYVSLVSQLTQLKTQYTMLKNNLEHFSVKQQWETALTQMEHINVANQFGETGGMTTAFNTNSPSAASTAWTNATIPVNSSASAYLASQNPNSASRSQLAMIEASDAASPDCMNAVGAYRAARDSNASAQQNLQAEQIDGNDDTNTEVQQLNLLNASQAQHLQELQAQGAIHACLAQQMAIQNMQQRNAAAQDLNTWGNVQAQHQANPTLNVASSSTWTTYVP
jgi:hypothetical protein